MPKGLRRLLKTFRNPSLYFQFIFMNFSIHCGIYTPGNIDVSGASISLIPISASSGHNDVLKRLNINRLTGIIS